MSCKVFKEERVYTIFYSGNQIFPSSYNISCRAPATKCCFSYRVQLKNVVLLAKLDIIMGKAGTHNG